MLCLQFNEIPSVSSRDYTTLLVVLHKHGYYTVKVCVIISGAADVFFKLNSIMKSFCYASDNYAKVRVFHVAFSGHTINELS